MAPLAAAARTGQVYVVARAAVADYFVLGIVATGCAFGLSGAFVMQGANAYLSDAINEYNADLANRLKGGVANLRPTHRFGLCGSLIGAQSSGQSRAQV